MKKDTQGRSIKLSPIEEARLRLEKEELGRYDPREEKENVIYWGNKPLPTVNIFNKLRTLVWFWPDYLVRLIHQTRPISFLVFYAALSLIIFQGLRYASSNPRSVLSFAPEQVLYEGTIGTVSSINPLFITNNQTERDLQSLVFNQLIRIKADGTPEPDLVKTWSVSSDGKTYTFFLRKNVKWQDGVKLTADDVIFTFEFVQQLDEEESLAAAFEKVKIGKIDEYTVTFELPEKRATFVESLQVGILPKHTLGEVTPGEIKRTTFNLFPIGTGPFQVTENTEEQIVLVRNNSYFRGKPKIEKIILNLFPDEETALDSLREFKIHTLNNPSRSIAKEMEDYKSYTTEAVSLRLRSKVIYLNLREGSSPFSETGLRQALSMATDRTELIKLCCPKAKESTGPIYEESWAYNADINRYQFNIEEAEKAFEEAGWKYPEEKSKYREKDGNKLAIKLSYLDSEMNNEIAEGLKKQWNRVGIEVIVDAQTYEKIAGETVPTRNFEALLFEIESTSDPDKYNLWHSLKSEYPGLNLPGYSYERVDIILERARQNTNQDERKSDYDLFQKYIMRDMPAIYLFHPTYNFIVHESIKGLDLDDVSLPQDRYHNVEDWYIK